MRKTLIGVLLILAILSFSQLAVADTISNVEVTDAEITDGTSFGAGSDYPLMTPMESGYVHVYSIEPTKITWTVYDPTFHYVTTIEHPPSTKYQEGTEWRFADATTFTLPSFAAKGNWVASCKVTFIDGSSATITWDGYIYQGIPCGSSGDILPNIFLYPWYAFGTKMPAYVWVPGFILWVPLLYIGFCAIFSRSIGGFVDMTKQMLKSAKAQRGKLRRGRAKGS
jgi:hypothetical protein